MKKVNLYLEILRVINFLYYIKTVKIIPSQHVTVMKERME